MATGPAGRARYASRVAHEEEHRDISSGGPRAAVFGVADGLVTNVSLILGFAGAGPTAGVVRLAGLAGLVAGAFSMGAGEYLSMGAQRGMFQRELDIERRALAESPDTETEELYEIFVSKGMEKSLARRLAVEVMSDPELALETHAREEFGVDPSSLGSPVAAALSSFVAFSVGAFIPLLAWLIGSGDAAIASSIVLSGLAAIGVGAVLGHLTARSVVFGAVRFLAVTSVAAAVTFGIGHVVGTA